MGKRKERRLAALNSAGRRVKLDLSAEPPGNLGRSYTLEEVGGDLDLNHHAGLPNSPSYSGQQAENPLLLLGQYSDDEVDVQSNGRLDTTTVESLLATDDVKVRGSAAEECGEVEANLGANLADQTDEEQDNKNDTTSQDVFHGFDGNTAGDGVATAAAGQLFKEIDSSEQVSVPATSDLPVTGDDHSGWKMVLHEESNQYYYWNTETGETSWVVPECLVQEAELTDEQKFFPASQGTEVAVVGSYGSNSELIKQHEMHIIVTSGAVNLYEHVPQMCELNGVELHQNGTIQGAGAGTETGEHKHERFPNAEQATGAVLSSGLIEHGECLLKRLNSLKQFKGHLQEQDWVLRFMMEIEVRLSDIRALLSHGSSLLPFWEYSVGQLKQLEGAIDDEINKSFSKANEDETPAASSIGEDSKLTEDIKPENRANSHLFPEHSVPIAVTTTVQTDPVDKAPDNGIAVSEFVNSSEHPTAGSNEYVDMDVDMEVEDASPMDNNTLQVTLHDGHVTSRQEPNILEGGFVIPPPPDEEWIPPPPPDSESVPPPPPDEPPDPSFSESAQQFSYTEPYELLYPNSNFQFYGQPITEGHEACYEVVPSSYINTADSVYYKVEDGTVPCIPTVATAESVDFETSMESLDTSMHAVECSSSKENIPVPVMNRDTSVTAINGAFTAAKIGSKVARGRKRTVAVAPSLRSNKKVSKLVDKWKAAKEELDEDEDDEPENAYDILEKKRQREIEEWHARQIASGDAKENANFQPLVGDWRERVKRRRAAREGRQSASDANGQPNLVDLSRDLPIGWQAFWDECSKQVYYGNATTSETTWSRPTK